MTDLDQELDAIRAGNADAFGRWLAGAERAVRLSLRSFAGAVDTESALQEALLRVWNIAPKIKVTGPNSLLRYAIATARNVAIDEIRRTGREISLDTADPSPEIPDPRAAFPDPFIGGRIRDCYKRLPPRPRAVLAARLTDAGAHSDPYLAERLRMKLNTFHQNFGRARRMMAECLEAQGIALP